MQLELTLSDKFKATGNAIYTCTARQSAHEPKGRIIEQRNSRLLIGTRWLGARARCVTFCGPTMHDRLQSNRVLGRDVCRAILGHKGQTVARFRVPRQRKWIGKLSPNVLAEGRENSRQPSPPRHLFGICERTRE